MTPHPAWPHGDPDAVVRNVLAARAYRDAGPSTAIPDAPSVWALVWNWFVDHLLRPLFTPIAHVLSAARGFETALGIVLVVATVGAFALLVFRLVAAFARPVRPASGVSPGAALAGAYDARELRALATAAAARGDFARAIAALFAAALVALDERALVAFDAARTPGEYRRLVRRACVAAAIPFDELAERFVRALYAPVAPGPSDFEAAERALAAFEPALGA